MRRVSEELGNAMKEATGPSLPHFALSFLFLPVGGAPPDGSAAVWPGLLAIHVSVSAPSSYSVPLFLSPLSSSASLSLPLLPPPLRPLLPNSETRNVSVAAPPPASCLPFSPVCLGASPCISPLSFRLSSPRLGSDDPLCVPPLVASAGFFSVLFLYGYHAQELVF